MKKTTAGVVVFLATVVIIAVGCPAPDMGLRSGEGSDVIVQQDGTGCCIMIRKYQDLSNDGALDPEDPEISWPVYYADPNGAVYEDVTPQWCINADIPGVWTIWEGAVEDWWITGAMVNWGMVDDFTEPIEIDIPAECEGTYEIIFLNAEGKVLPPNGECNLTIRKINDLNSNGLVDEGEPEIGVDELVDGGGWPIFITDPSGEEYADETPVCINVDVPGMWTVTEGSVEGWWQTGLIVNGYPVELVEPSVGLDFTGACDEQYEVIFLNTTCGGGEPGTICAFKGYDADGDGPDNDTPIEGWLICLIGCDEAGNELGPFCEYTNCDGYVCWNDLAPGYYTVCEVMPEGDWVSSTPDCVEVELGEGGNEEVVFSNYCFTEVEMYTKGWWQSKHGCEAITDDPTLLDALNALAPFMSGTVYTRGTNNCTGGRCGAVTLPFDSASELGCYIVAPNSQDWRLGMAQQLAAFVLNVVNETGSLDLYFCDLDMTAQEIVDDAVEAWQCGFGVKYWQCVLDLLNNAEEIETVSPEPCPIVYCDGEDGDDDCEGGDDDGDDCGEGN